MIRNLTPGQIFVIFSSPQRNINRSMRRDSYIDKLHKWYSRLCWAFFWILLRRSSRNRRYERRTTLLRVRSKQDALDIYAGSRSSFIPSLSHASFRFSARMTLCFLRISLRVYDDTLYSVGELINKYSVSLFRRFSGIFSQLESRKLNLSRLR